MTFRNIFEEEGLYKAESFAPGVAFQIKKNKISDSRELWMLTYKNIGDINPTAEPVLIYEELFNKEYEKVLTIQKLFKK